MPVDEYHAGRQPDNSEPQAPVLVSPASGDIDTSPTPELNTQTFVDTDGDRHDRTEWQISSVEGDFSDSARVLSVGSGSFLTSLTVPGLILNAENKYHWRVKFYDSRGGASEWSTVFSFTTAATADDDLNGILDDQEVAGTVDLDNDETPDVNQVNIKSINTAAGDRQIGIKISENISAIEALNTIDPATIPESENRPDETPFGLVGFKLSVTNASEPARVIIYLSEPVPAGAKWYKYDRINGWQDYSDYATFDADGKSLILQLKDGGYGDVDGTANKIIVDPGGVGLFISSQPAPSDSDSGSVSVSSGGGGGGGCFIATAAFGSPAEESGEILRRFRNAYLLPTRVGRIFVRAYYRYSPPAADFIARHDFVRRVVRWSLLPVVGASWMVLRFGPVAFLTLMALLLAFMGAAGAAFLKRNRPLPS